MSSDSHVQSLVALPLSRLPYDEDVKPLQARLHSLRNAQLRTVLDRTVAAAFGVDPLLMAQSSRGRAEIARARQVAMYLAHVVCGLNLTSVGELYERDRTTVAHACQIVEDLRERQTFDSAVQHLECAVVIMLQASELSGMIRNAGRLM